MRKGNYKTSQFAVCVNNTGNPASLTLCKIYPVLPDKEAEEMDQIRVIDNDGEDYLYPAENFILIDFPPKVRQTLLRVFHSESSAPR